MSEEHIPGCDGEEIVLRQKKDRSRKFVGCTGYPECPFIRSYVGSKDGKLRDPYEESAKKRRRFFMDLKLRQKYPKGYKGTLLK